jgi:endonuclease IV
VADVDLFERIDEGLRQILDSQQPEPLNEYVAAKTTDIQVSFRDTHS